MLEQASRTERIIAGARLVLAIAAFALLIVEPAQSSRDATEAHRVAALYFLYAVAVMWIIDRGLMRAESVGIYSQVLDTLWFPIILIYTQGENSPFFLYYVYSLVTAGFRWGFLATLLCNTANVAMYTIVHLATVQSQFEFSRFWVRPTYLYVLACLIGYLGEYQKRTQRNLRTLAELSGSIRLKSQFPRMLGEAMEKVRQLFQADQCILLLEDRDTGQIVARKTGEGSRKSLHHSASLPAGEADFLLAPRQNLGYLVNPHRRVARIFGLKDVLLFDFDTQKPAAQKFEPSQRLASLFEMESMLSVPIILGSEFRGRLYLVNRGGRVFAYADLQHLNLVVSQLAPLLDNYRLLQRMQRVVVLEEKNRIARDLHDGLLQSLASLDLRLEVCRKVFRNVPSPILDELQEFQKIVRDEYGQLRSYMKRLKTPAFAGRELQEALEDYARVFEKESGLKVKLALPAEPIGFSRNTGREVYQIIHEALANVRRHANAHAVEVKLEEQAGIAQLVISDDGCGFPEVSGGSSEGAVSACPWSIHERTRVLGGSLKVESGAGRGSRLLLEIPVMKPLDPSQKRK
ncbi:MAG: GAF domain-containing sensor histidine kinase [Acidobacteria bacterium]|nr:GAF domain-containing sensor histidine kinase [Acidobacteriota bacterium]